MDEYCKTNLLLWNEWAHINPKSAFYDLEGFKSGKTSLKRVEIEELGNVSGKSLLHLQCHFGLDTLSWARQGADVVGVDFSDEAISFARALSKEIGKEAEFICSDIYELPQKLNRKFDIVFTSYGVLSWLRDIGRWGEIIGHYLTAQGTFYIVEFHPYANMLDDEGEKIIYPYFHTGEPLKFENVGSYADRKAGGEFRSYEWIHTLSDIINSLIRAGLRIEFIREFPFSSYDCFAFTEKDCDETYRMKGGHSSFPLMFSIKAVMS